MIKVEIVIEDDEETVALNLGQAQEINANDTERRFAQFILPKITHFLKELLATLPIPSGYGEGDNAKDQAMKALEVQKALFEATEREKQ